jgi:serine/threonine protein phosphatase PrpC
MALSLLEPKIYLNEDLQDIATFAFAGGTVCIYTARSPEKTTPNEDSLALLPCAEQTGVLVIADGLGGLRAGDQASRHAVQCLASTVMQCCTDQDSMREAILNGVEQADEQISAMGLGAATTVAIVEIREREVRPYHVGDSMTLITGQRGRVKYLTVPHSPVGYAVESGLLDANEAMYHEERHLVSNVVGTPHMHVEIGPRVSLAARDTLLVASDGLYDNLQVDEIAAIIRKGPLPVAAKTLAAQCRTRMQDYQPDRPHKPDDMSFILFRPG